MSIKAVKSPPGLAGGNIAPLPALSGRASEMAVAACDLSEGGVVRLVAPDNAELVELDIDNSGDDAVRTKVWFAAIPAVTSLIIPEDDEDIPAFVAQHGKRISIAAGGTASRVLRVQDGDRILIHSVEGTDVALTYSLAS